MRGRPEARKAPITPDERRARSAVLVEVAPQLFDRGEAHGAVRQLCLDGAVGEQRVGHLVDHTGFQDRQRARLGADRFGMDWLRTGRLMAGRFGTRRFGTKRFGTLLNPRRFGASLGSRLGALFGSRWFLPCWFGPWSGHRRHLGQSRHRDLLNRRQRTRLAGPHSGRRL
jgi:hypothetical protein